MGFWRVGAEGLCLLLGALLLLEEKALASLAEAMSLAELVRESELIAEIEVEALRSRYDEKGRIVTEVDARLREVLKGKRTRGERIRILRLGGVVGDLGLRVEGEPHFEVGMRALAFLWAMDGSGQGFYRPVGMSQGIFPCVEEGGQWVVRPGGEGLALVRVDEKGRLRGARGVLVASEPLYRFVERIRELVAEERREALP
ncbi:MAG: hypothetical protein NZM37_03865 [Sandaracinaceae bacterium]|nr:hypothetical protein [Sandaracinaceae bacterium]